MYYRRPPRTKKPAAPPARLPQELVDEFRDRPFGIVGETTAPRPAEPPPPAPDPGLVIEEPPWKTNPAAYLTPPAEPAPRTPALQELMADEPYDPPPPGPIEKLEPLIRPKIPEWPEEERLRERLAREREQLGIHEEEPASHPPIRRVAP